MDRKGSLSGWRSKAEDEYIISRLGGVAWDYGRLLATIERKALNSLVSDLLVTGVRNHLHELSHPVALP